MARTRSTASSPKARAELPEASNLSPEDRLRMIGEAAYYRYEQRGYAHGHAEEDWLAAEAEFDRASRRRQAGAARHSSESATILEFGGQLGGGRRPAEDDALKRDLKAHPRRDIPRIESMEPEDAPLKE